MDAVQAVRSEIDGRVARITLDRPEKLNALDGGVREGLAGVVATLAERPDVSVLVLGGAGRAFSAGFDLTEPPLPGEPGTWAERRHAAGAWQRLLDALERIPQVTVAALHGAVVGGAALLAAACDLRVATPTARLSIPEVAIGIPLTWAGLPRLVREVGLPRTRDLVMTGREVTGEELHAWGFVQRLAPEDGLDGAVGELVGELLAMPPGPLAVTRAGLRALDPTPSGAGWSDPDLLAAALAEPEQREAAEAYLEARLRGRTPGGSEG